MVWVVFEMFDFCWDVVFCVMEIDDMVVLFVIIIFVMCGDMIVVVMVGG